MCNSISSFSLFFCVFLLEKALEYFQQALDLHKEKLQGNEIHEVIASSINNIGSILSIMGRYEEAAKVLERSLEVSGSWEYWLRMSNQE